MDDLMPIELWSEEWKGIVNYKREFALKNPRAGVVEVRATATTSAVLMKRIQ